MEPFLIRRSLGVFKFFSGFTPYGVFKCCYSRGRSIDEQTDTALTEWWIFGNLVASGIFCFVSNFFPSWLLAVMALYIFFRICEAFFIYLFYTQILGGAPTGFRYDSPTLIYNLYSYRRAVVISMLLYLELLFWFGGIYRVTSSWFSGCLDSLFSPLYFSVVTMLTIGYGEIHPTNTFGYILVIIHGIMGMFVTLFVLARFISYIPKPGTRDLDEERTLIYRNFRL